MTDLLDDVRVVDLSRIIAGPYAAQALADLGADVIKVESPSGDRARRIGPHVDGRSLYFASVNSGKRSVVLDLASPAGRESLDAILGTSDIVIESFRTATAARLGTSPDRLLQRHPHLVVVSVPGYARSTPRGDDPAYDLVVQAESGLMRVTGEPGRPPVRCGVPVGDLAAGLWAGAAAVSGFVRRLRSGSGVHIEVPLLDAALSLLSYVGTSAAGTGSEPPPVGSGHHTQVPYGAFPTRDGWVALAVIGDRFWKELVAALDLEGLSDLDDNEIRRQRRSEVEGAIAARLSQLTRAEALALLRRSGVPHAPVLGVLEAMSTPYVRDTGLVQQLGTGEHGYRVVTGPIRRTIPLRPAPALGEHTDEVLREVAAQRARRSGTAAAATLPAGEPEREPPGGEGTGRPGRR